VTADVVVVLAAGGSSRLGHPKQLIPWRGTTLLAHAAHTADRAALGPVVVMLGAHADSCRTALMGSAADIVECPQWAEGMGRTIGAAIAHVALIYPGAEAALLMTCDQPLVTEVDLVAIADARRSSGRRMAAAAYEGTIGVPAVFSHSMFDDLRKLQGDRGAASILRRWKAEVVAVPCPNAAQDVDTGDDAELLQ
jgi:molybdenum cofactor cytidylyltransferase